MRGLDRRFLLRRRNISLNKIHCCYRIISTELKEDLLSIALPSEQDTVSPSVSLSHQEASISLLSLSIREQTEWKSQSQKTNQIDHMTTSLSNSMKLWAMPYRATQDKRVMVGSSDKTWSTGEGNGKPHFSILALRTVWTVWKGKIIGYWMKNSPGQ